MKLFIKAISNKPEMIDNIPSVWGEITIENFKETFVIPLEYWNIEDYQKQWKEGIERIKKNSKSCFVASIQDPCKAPYLNWWPMYKRGKTIYIQNHMLHGKYYKKKIGSQVFTPETCYNFIPYRTTKEIDGMKPSEWKVELP